MTTVNPQAPVVTLAPLIRCGAGISTSVEVEITHTGTVSAWMNVTILGLDAAWVPPAVVIGPLEPGETTRATLTLLPERGALGAKYPFVIAVESNPVVGNSPPVIGVAESVLAVDGRDRITLTVFPQTPVVVFSRRIKVQVTNPGHTDRELTLTGSAARGAAISLQDDYITVPAGRTVVVAGRVRVTHPRIIGGQNTHTFAVGARGLGAPEYAEGSLRSKPLLGGKLTGALILALIVVVWAAAAVIAIPKVSQYFSGSDSEGSTSVSTASGTAGSSRSAGAPGSAGASGSAVGSGSAGGGGSGASGAGAAGGAAGTAVDGAELSGTVTGAPTKGIAVSLEPTSLVEAANEGAQAAPGVTDTTTANALRDEDGAAGKVPEEAVMLGTADPAAGIRQSTTRTDGSFSFAGIPTVGYFLLTLAAPGFETQRFIVNGATLANATPMKVAMLAGNGTMTGLVTSPSGPVGAATVAITDGTVALQTSSASVQKTPAKASATKPAVVVGKPGSWTVQGLSTPGSYLVTVTATGYGTASELVTLAAGAAATANLALTPGVAAIVGKVSGIDELGGSPVGLGGVTVTASGTSQGATTSRTATTVTSGPVGTFALPNLPIPGAYTVTVTGAGYESQTRTVTLAAGVSSATVDLDLTRSEGVVSGAVFGAKGAAAASSGVIGAGLTLTGNTATFKTMTTSSPAGGFRFTGVPPGTYVLTGAQFGRLSSSVTLVVAAAGTTTATLILLADPNNELPDNGRIRGQVVDARTQGALTCDRAALPVPVAKCQVTAAVTVPINPSVPNGAMVTVTDTVNSKNNYTLPALGDHTIPGLVPGDYVVTLSAPGYETTTVQVQVAAGQIAPAAQVALQPLGLISGTVTTRVGATATPTCVVAVPAGAAVPTACNLGSATSCTVPGSAGARCIQTDAAGGYQIRGLIHGGYQVEVIPTDPEYVQAPPLAVQLALGDDYRYDPVLDRLGRATVTVLAVDISNLALNAANGAAVTLLDGTGRRAGTPLPGDSTANDGVITLTRLLGAYTAKASGAGGSASIPTGVIALDQTVAVTLVLTSAIGAVVGHVTVTVDGGVRNVVGATVHVTGTVGFSARNPVSGTVSVKTDVNGCYAVIPANWPTTGAPPLTATGCPAPVAGGSVGIIKDTSGAAESLVALPITDNVDQLGISTQATAVTQTLITGTGQVKVIPPISVTTVPSSAAGLVVVLDTPANVQADPRKSTYVFTRRPAGAGNVTVTADPPVVDLVHGASTSALTFADSTLSPGRLVPGRYTLTASQLGFNPVTVNLWCDLGTPCRFATFAADGTVNPSPPVVAFVQKELPTISGTISVPGSLPAGVTLDQTAVHVTGQPTGAGSINVFVDANGVVTYRDASLADAQADRLPGGLAVAGTYTFAVSLSGYDPDTVTVVCAADFQTPTGTGSNVGCDPLSTQLVPLPRFSGSIAVSPTVTIDPVTDGVDNIAVTVTPQADPANPIRLTLDSTDSTFTTLSWRDPNQPVDVVNVNNYVVTFSKTGYQTLVVPFDCAAAETVCDLGNQTLQMLPLGTGSVTVKTLLPSNAPIDWTQAVVTINSRPPTSTNLSISVAADPVTPDTKGDLVFEDTTIGYPGITQPGPYAITVSLPGYSSLSQSFTCPVDATSCGPGDLTLTRLPGFTGTLAVGSTNPSLTPDLTGVTISVSPQPNRDTPIQVSIDSTAGASSALTWTDPSEPPGIVNSAAAPYQLTFSKAGFADLQATLNCTSGSCDLGTQTMQMFPFGGGTVSVTDPLPNVQAVDWSGAVVSVISAPSGSAALGITISSTGDKTGQLNWADSNLPYPGTTQPGPYIISVTLAGYSTATSASFTCSVGDTDCGPNLILTRLAGFTGTVALNDTVSPNPGTGLAGVTVAISPQPAKPITVTTDPTSGALTWNDPAQPVNVVAPNNYTLTFTAAGYASHVVPFSCPKTATSCDLGTVTLNMDPAGTGLITATAPPPNATSVPWASATVAIGTKPPLSTGLSIALEVDPGDPFQATLVWTDSSLPFTGITYPGTYNLTITVPGYTPLVTATFTCSAGDKTCGPNLTLAPQPAANISVATDPAGGSLVGAAISVKPPAGVDPVNATVAATAADPTNGAVDWQEQGQPAGVVSYGTYTLVVSEPGYLGQTVTWSCTKTSCPALVLVLTQPSGLEVDMVGAQAGTPPVDGALVTLTGSTISSTTVTAAPNSNSVTFPSLTPGGTYQLEIQAAGYAASTVGPTSTSVTCVNGTGIPTTGLSVSPGGTTICTVSLTQLGTIVGLATGITTNSDGSTTTNTLPGINFTARQLVAGKPTGTPFIGASDPNGNVVITGTNINAGLADGTWEVTASPTGYTPLSGTVLIAGAAMKQDPAATGLTVAAGVLQLRLKVKDVAVQVHLVISGVDSLPTSTVTLAGPGLSASCIITMAANGTITCNDASGKVLANPSIVNTAKASYVNFAVVPPGGYTVSDTSTVYGTQSAPAQVVVGVDPQVVPLPLTEKSSTQNGTVTLANGGASSAVTVSLRAQNDIDQVATDITGKKQLLQTTGADGSFSFLRVPDGQYYLVAVLPGYIDAVYGSLVTENSSSGSPPVPLSLQLTSRATRPVTITVTSKATGIDLTGTTLTLTPTVAIAGLPTDATLSETVSAGAGAAAGTFVAIVPQLGTGSWSVSVSGQTGAQFVTGIPAVSIAVPEVALNDTNPSTTPVSVDLAEALATITYTWTSNSCLSEPAAGSLPIELQRGTSAPVEVDAAITGTTAVAKVYLPAGSYTGKPTLGTGWSGAAAGFTVAATDSAKTVPPITLTALTVPTAVTMSIDGSTGGVPGLTVAGMVGTTTPVPAVDLSSGSASLCTVVGKAYSVTVAPGTAEGDEDVSVLPKPFTATTAGPNKVSFAGFTITPKVTLTTVTNRPADAANLAVPVVIDRGTAAVYSDTATIPGGGTSGAAPAVVLDTQAFKLTATPPAGPFTAVNGQAFTVTAAATVTATLPYTALTLTVTAKVAAVAEAGADVSLLPVPSGVSDQQTVVSGNTAFTVFIDIPVGKYAITASWTDTSVTPNVQYSHTVSAPATAYSGSAAVTVTMVKGGP